MNKIAKAFLTPLCVIVFTFTACRSITRSAGEINMPPSTVIFSFDDGPNREDDTTARLLDVLGKYNINAMFVLLGRNAEENSALVKRIYEEGHCIVSHGYSGKWAIEMSDDEFRDSLAMAEKAISAAIGNAAGGEPLPRLYRPHGGFYTERQEEILREEGYVLVPGSVRIYDANLSGRDRDRAVSEVIRKVEKQNGGIVLLHDGRDAHTRMERKLARNPRGVYDRSWIPQAVEEMIVKLLAAGFTFADPSVFVNTEVFVNTAAFVTPVPFVLQN